MSEIKIEFVNGINDAVYQGSVSSNDTVKGTIELLLNEEEFSNLEDDAVLKTQSGDLLDGYKKFHELNLEDGTRLFLSQNSSNSNNRNKKIQEPPIPGDDILPPQQFHQLGIFVMDGSASMNELTNGNVKKKDAVNMAIRDVLTRFKVSRKKNNFSFSVVAFDFKATVQTATCPLKSINENENFDPTINHGSGTYIYSGLEEAKSIAQDFLSNPTSGVPHSVIILLLSDGECHEPNKTIEIANDLKNIDNITICTTFLSRAGENNKTAENLMKKIATDPVIGFKRTYDPDTLRNFFESSISRASGVKIS